MTERPCRLTRQTSAARRRNHREKHSWLSAVAAVLFVFFGAVPVTAQQQVISGTVLDARNLRPLENVQVRIENMDLGDLTDRDGSFRIVGALPSQVVLIVTRIGYRPVTQTVGVGTTGNRILLTASALSLDEVVVTGTVGEQTARSIGNAVGRVRAEDIMEIAAPTDVRELLGARISGVNVVNGLGEVGSGGATAIRGVGSLSLSHEPLIYVDGIRIDNDPNDGGTVCGQCGAARINDINPEDIESVEIIKGPAATTLYGTEASNGVIQIITKRGRAQAAEWNFRIDQGATYLPNATETFPTVYGRSGGELISLNLVQNEIDIGNGSPFRTGHNQRYGVSVGGGTADAQYYLSGDWNRREGVVDYNWQNKLNLRSNLSFVLGDQLDLQFNFGAVRMRTRSASASQPVTTMIIWGIPALKDTPQRGFIANVPEDYETVHGIEQQDRETVNVQLNHRPTDWLNHRLVVGGDFGFTRHTELFERTPEQPGPFGALSEGSKEVEETRNSLVSVDYTATAGVDLRSDIRAETSVGGNFFRRVVEGAEAEGTIFPVPGLETVSAASSRAATESFLEERTLGAFVQEQLSFNDRIFLTVGLRGDDHSAFGKNFDFVLYPKISGSWVISDEAFLRDVGFLTALKLRGAWGQAGQQPSTFAAIRLYSPSTGDNATPTVTPSNVGNPDLEPEKGQEIELGFDASLFQDRLGLEFTYYNQRTKQALIDAPVRPSTGFPGEQSLNVGEIANKGIELVVNATPIRQDNLTWSLGVVLGTNSNKIVDLGGIEIPPAIFNREVEGFPISSIFQRKVVSAEYDASGNLVNVLCDGGRGPSGMDAGGPAVDCSEAGPVYWGHPLPSWQGNVSTSVTLWRNLSLYALADFQGGHHRINGDVAASHLFFNNSRCINEQPICDPLLAAYASLGEVWQTGTMKAGFAKLRTLSASYSFPRSLVRKIGASRGTITIAGQNLIRLWTAEDESFGHPITDPEIGKESTALDTYNQELWPQFTTITTTIRLTF